jgi:hypothetical protein
MLVQQHLGWIARTRTSGRDTVERFSERELVDHLVQSLSEYQREVVVNYYVALKSKRFVVLTGAREEDKMRLPRALAGMLVGQSPLRWSALQTHAWWTTNTGTPGYFAKAQAQLNWLKLWDVIETSAVAQASGKTIPFFLGFSRMSLAELVCYFQDLPLGLLWQADGSTSRVSLPGNVYATGTLEVATTDGFILGEEVRRNATVIEIPGETLISPSVSTTTQLPRQDWQAEFARTDNQRIDHARAKLARIVPSGDEPIAPFTQLEQLLQGESLRQWLLRDAWLYLANAFDRGGCGLFVEPTVENLRIAQDHVFVQTVLPYLKSQLARACVAWPKVSALLEPDFPRACSWMQHWSVQQ